MDMCVGIAALVVETEFIYLLFKCGRTEEEQQQGEGLLKLEGYPVGI